MLSLNTPAQPTNAYMLANTWTTNTADRAARVTARNAHRQGVFGTALTFGSARVTEAQVNTSLATPGGAVSFDATHAIDSGRFGGSAASRTAITNAIRSALGADDVIAFTPAFATIGGIGVLNLTSRTNTTTASPATELAHVFNFTPGSLGTTSGNITAAVAAVNLANVNAALVTPVNLAEWQSLGAQNLQIRIANAGDNATAPAVEIRANPGSSNGARTDGAAIYGTFTVAFTRGVETHTTTVTLNIPGTVEMGDPDDVLNVTNENGLTTTIGESWVNEQVVEIGSRQTVTLYVTGTASANTTITLSGNALARTNRAGNVVDGVEQWDTDLGSPTIVIGDTVVATTVVPPGGITFGFTVHATDNTLVITQANT
jgi:hypothetical protein